VAERYPWEGLGQGMTKGTSVLKKEFPEVLENKKGGGKGAHCKNERDREKKNSTSRNLEEPGSGLESRTNLGKKRGKKGS